MYIAGYIGLCTPVATGWDNSIMQTSWARVLPLLNSWPHASEAQHLSVT